MAEKVTITVADEVLDRIDDVVDALREGGMRIDQVLRPIGVITGEIEQGHMQALAAVTGVSSIEPDRKIQLPPPNSDIQ